MKASPLSVTTAPSRECVAGAAAGTGRWMLHIDFDAFFVSVALLKQPHLKDKPVAVCHSRGRQGGRLSSTEPGAARGSPPRGGSTSEIASCNYPARMQGVKKGMWLRSAFALCPSLKLLPYDFDGIENASEGLFRVALSLSHRLIPLSCDETFLQISFPLVLQTQHDDNLIPQESSGSSGSQGSTAETEAEKVAAICVALRRIVLKMTGCSVSVGAGSNCLLARLATAAAKPSGVSDSAAEGRPLSLSSEEAVLRREGVCVVKAGAASAAAFVGPLLLRQLPGVGLSMIAKINAAQEAATPKAAPLTCRAVQMKGKEMLHLLQRALGQRRGTQLWWMCHGVDVRPLPPSLPGCDGDIASFPGAAAIPTGGIPASGSLSLSVNWGVRLKTEADLFNLLYQLALEAHKRLKKSGLYTTKISVKLLYRQPGASFKTTKFLGCGVCDAVRASRVVGGVTSNTHRRACVVPGIQVAEALIGRAVMCGMLQSGGQSCVACCSREGVMCGMLPLVACAAVYVLWRTIAESRWFCNSCEQSSRRRPCGSSSKECSAICMAKLQRAATVFTAASHERRSRASLS
ncbi:family domain-containing protein [Cyclospora cayetanensis]|uniref:Family domain-containing protein n=1 Tax=Cyclospora cayetanensis TaxID=88456 RepID=A0A1D3D0Z6_9EIME|nr:family domain-containing protein [Cyclospora cayetanensis]